MSKRTVAFKACDRCGKPDAKTRSYLWFGARYEIDLCPKHDEQFHDVLNVWIDKSRLLSQPLSIIGLAPPPTAPAPPIPRPTTPGPERMWMHTAHSLERCKERKIDPEVARKVAYRPEVVTPSAKDPTYEERVAGNVLVVVEPATFTIITVAHRTREQIANG